MTRPSIPPVRAEERLRIEREMCHKHGEALQRIGSALDLLPGSDLHRDCVPAIMALKNVNAALLDRIQELIAERDKMRKAAGKAR